MDHFPNPLGKLPIVSDSAIEKVVEHDLEIKMDLLITLNWI